MRFFVVASFSGFLYGCGGGGSSQLRPVSTDDEVGVSPSEMESNAAAGVNDPGIVGIELYRLAKEKSSREDCNNSGGDGQRITCNLVLGKVPWSIRRILSLTAKRFSEYIEQNREKIYSDFRSISSFTASAGYTQQMIISKPTRGCFTVLYITSSRDPEVTGFDWVFKVKEFFFRNESSFASGFVPVRQSPVAEDDGPLLKGSNVDKSGYSNVVFELKRCESGNDEVSGRIKYFEIQGDTLPGV
jgi:hypothetical protein